MDAMADGWSPSPMRTSETSASASCHPWGRCSVGPVLNVSSPLIFRSVFRKVSRASAIPRLVNYSADLAEDKQGKRDIREAHPEVTFAQLNGGRAMLHYKKTLDGRRERISILKKAGVQISEEWLSEKRSSLPPGAVALDDLLDAMACLVTARHIRMGRSRSLGRGGQEDAKGLLMEIVTCDRTFISG